MSKNRHLDKDFWIDHAGKSSKN